MRKKIFALGTCLVLTISMLAGCGGTASTATTAAASKAATTAAATQAATTLAAAATTKAAATTVAAAAASSDDPAAKELYAMLPKTDLSGVFSPNIADRASIKKAWPKKPAKDGTLTIGWTEQSQANPWFVAVKNSSEATAKKYGYDLTFLVANNDVQTQTQQIESFITKGVDAIVIDPCDIKAIVTDIKHCVEAGIPVLCIGSQPDDSAPILTTISDNPYYVGYNAGLYAGSTFEKDVQINMACIPGQLGNTSAESRVNGIVGGVIAARQKALGKFTTEANAILTGTKLFEEAKSNGSSSNDELKVAILNVGEGKWSEEGGLAAAEPIITASGSKLNLMVADNEFQCFGIKKAVNNAGLTDKIKVGTCADGTNAALKQIVSGDILMSGSWNGDQQGSHAIEFLKAIFFDGKDPSDLPVGSFFTPLTFTKDNAAKYINPDTNANFFAVPDFAFPQSIPEKNSAAK